ncbi:MAG: hypothetical protein RLZZ630_1835 [Bacteroidota bacterium]|jgi:23S rRNA pseudouridine2457 synthase
MPEGLKYFLVYKPYGMVSRFTPEDGHPGLKELGTLPADVYPVGRLDADSEGLLLLTNDTSLNEQLLHPRHAHSRTYLVQVEKEIDEPALEKLREGIEIRIDGRPHHSAPAKAERIDEPALPPRVPPIRFRKDIPTSWIELTMSEGKNRQVRRMTAAVGFPTLRLARIRIEGLTMDEPLPGKIIELSGAEVYAALGIKQKPMTEKSIGKKRQGRRWS